MFRSEFKTKKPRPMSERDLKQRLDRICSLITRLETPYCVLCGSSNWAKLEAGHFWHRDMPATTHDLTNLSTLCRKCNARHEHDPQPYRDYLLIKLGERGYADLAEKAHSNFKVGYAELLDTFHRLELRLTEIKEHVA